MGIFAKASYITISVLAISMLLDAVGFGIFSRGFFTDFGAFFFFVTFLNEMGLVFMADRL